MIKEITDQRKHQIHGVQQVRDALLGSRIGLGAREILVEMVPNEILRVDGRF